MVITSMAGLAQALMSKVVSAMGEASTKILEDMRTETTAFYSQGSPKQYERTHALEGTPRVSSISAGATQVSFDAYLDKSHSYSKGSFTMGQVLDAAEVQGAGILGKPGFWKRSEGKMQKDLDGALGKYFH